MVKLPPWQWSSSASVPPLGAKSLLGCSSESPPKPPISPPLTVQVTAPMRRSHTPRARCGSSRTIPTIRSGSHRRAASHRSWRSMVKAPSRQRHFSPPLCLLRLALLALGGSPPSAGAAVPRSALREVRARAPAFTKAAGSTACDHLGGAGPRWNRRSEGARHRHAGEPLRQ